MKRATKKLLALTPLRLLVLENLDRLAVRVVFPNRRAYVIGSRNVNIPVRTLSRHGVISYAQGRYSIKRGARLSIKAATEAA